MYLVDTNVWLERLLDQDRSEEVGEFLSKVAADQLLMSDFTLHSIGVILNRLGQRSVLPRFVEDLFAQGNVMLVSVRPEAMHRPVEVMDQYNLDFDDAYQYVAAETYDARMVSFDTDFDRTDCTRLTPGEIIGVS
jgi:uncharacterized protein